jgi:hypothetical protein
MGWPLAYLQEVVWETYNGTYGPATLLKRVEHSTASCPECGGEGWYDHRGDVVCENDECGCVISNAPLLLPEDGFNNRCNGTGGKRALNPANPSEPEPNVQ